MISCDANKHKAKINMMLLIQDALGQYRFNGHGASFKLYCRLICLYVDIKNI